MLTKSKEKQRNCDVRRSVVEDRGKRIEGEEKEKEGEEEE